MSEEIELLEKLVAIDSVNPDLVPGGAGEGAIAAFLATLLDSAGAEIRRLERHAGRPSIVGTFRGRGGGRSLMLNGHIDSVGVEGMVAPFMPRIEGGRLYGRGAYDMKGGVAAMIVAATRAARSGLRGDIIVACVADEEVASLGSRELIETFHADAAIVTEPTGLELVVAHKGFVWAEIETHGRAAHGSRPDLGIDAITRLGRVLVGLEELENRLAGGQRHPLLGAASLHASTITGGVGWSTYPDRASLRLERRTLPGERVEAVEQELQNLLAGLKAADPTFESTLRLDLSREPHEVDPLAAIVTSLRQSYLGVKGHQSKIGGAHFWTDCAILGYAGIPTAMFGPDGEGAHADVEWVDLESVEVCTRILEATIRDFCA